MENIQKMKVSLHVKYHSRLLGLLRLLQIGAASSSQDKSFFKKKGGAGEICIFLRDEEKCLYNNFPLITAMKT